MKSKLLPALLIIVLSISCNSDDDDTSTYIGKWRTAYVAEPNAYGTGSLDIDFHGIDIREYRAYRMVGGRLYDSNISSYEEWSVIKKYAQGIAYQVDGDRIILDNGQVYTLNGNDLLLGNVIYKPINGDWEAPIDDCEIAWLEEVEQSNFELSQCWQAYRDEENPDNYNTCYYEVYKEFEPCF